MRFPARMPLAALLLALAPAFAHATCVPAPAGIVGWWPLDETGPGTALDRVYANNGAVNFTAGIQAGQFGPGEVGSAFRFLNSNTVLVLVPNTPKYGMGAGSLSIDAWIRPLTTNQLWSYLQPIVDTHVLSNTGLGYEEGHAGFAFYLKDNQLAFLMAEDNGTLSHYYSQTAPVVLNVWQHVAVVVQRDGTHPNLGTFYYDGQAVGTFAPSSASLSVTPFGLRIGGGPVNVFSKPSCGNT